MALKHLNSLHIGNLMCDGTFTFYEGIVPILQGMEIIKTKMTENFIDPLQKNYPLPDLSKLYKVKMVNFA